MAFLELAGIGGELVVNGCPLAVSGHQVMNAGDVFTRESGPDLNRPYQYIPEMAHKVLWL